MSNQKKRARSENWTREERDILLEIIKNYRHILDNQSNNTNTNKLKNIVWNHINNRFHEISSTKRDVPQLRSFWARLKLAARKKARSQSQTNGSVTSEEKLSHCGDSSPDEATNNISSFEHDYSMFGQTCNPSEVVLLVEPSRQSHSESDSRNIDEGAAEDEEIHNSSCKSNVAAREFEDTNDFDMPSQSISLQYRDSKENRETEDFKNLNKLINGPDVNYLQKEFLLKRFYLRRYHKNQLKHQHEKHKLEIENLLLERKKIELEIELSKRKLQLLDK